MKRQKQESKNNQDVIFHLPGAFIFHNAWRELLPFLKFRPEVLKENVKIGSIYGSPGCVWNGGRIIHTYCTKQLLEEVRDYMAEAGIPVRFTFTNCLIEEKHLSDSYGNLILNIFNTGNNEILCNSEILENYIRNNYDGYKYISSTTKRLDTVQEQNEELTKDYHLVVLDYDHNKDLVYLKGINNKDKCELLCNPVCRPKCAHRVAHYESISRCQLTYSEPDFMCDDTAKTFWMAQKNENFISVQDINNIYVPMGFSNFKLEGRTTNILDLVEIVVYYLIKEEYQLEVRDILQRALLR